MKNYISINFSYIRKTNYLSQKELADKYGLSSNVIGTYERGVSLPTITFLQQFCRDYNLNIDDFVNTDLSKKASKSHYVGDLVQKAEDSPDLYKAIAKKRDELYEKTLMAYKEIIEAKDGIISEKEGQIQLLKKHSDILEVLLNQNNTIESLQIIQKIDNEIDKAKHSEKG